MMIGMPDETVKSRATESDSDSTIVFADSSTKCGELPESILDNPLVHDEPHHQNLSLVPNTRLRGTLTRLVPLYPSTSKTG